jgi:hypothetical protein
MGAIFRERGPVGKAGRKEGAGNGEALPEGASKTFCSER